MGVFEINNKLQKVIPAIATNKPEISIAKLETVSNLLFWILELICFLLIVIWYLWVSPTSSPVCQ